MDKNKWVLGLALVMCLNVVAASEKQYPMGRSYFQGPRQKPILLIQDSKHFIIKEDRQDRDSRFVDESGSPYRHHEYSEFRPPINYGQFERHPKFHPGYEDFGESMRHYHHDRPNDYPHVRGHDKDYKRGRELDGGMYKNHNDDGRPFAKHHGGGYKYDYEMQQGPRQPKESEDEHRGDGSYDEHREASYDEHREGGYDEHREGGYDEHREGGYDENREQNHEEQDGKKYKDYDDDDQKMGTKDKDYENGGGKKYRGPKPGGKDDDKQLVAIAISSTSFGMDPKKGRSAYGHGSFGHTVMMPIALSQMPFVYPRGHAIHYG